MVCPAPRSLVPWKLSSIRAGTVTRVLSSKEDNLSTQSRSTTMKRKGFTLIELLIVVAIIGILAAIAVPNFLNAQTRAKVARTMSDIKALVNGLEMYSTDHGKYPEGGGGDVIPGTRKLTTPIAYLGALPVDPFSPTPGGPTVSGGGAGGWLPACLPHYVYLYAANKSDSLNDAISRDYEYRKGILKSPSGTPTKRYHFYQLRAMGPNMQGDWSMAYETSNGLMSAGDISFHGPGAGF